MGGKMEGIGDKGTGVDGARVEVGEGVNLSPFLKRVKRSGYSS
jgi:hypothetical protein